MTSLRLRKMGSLTFLRTGNLTQLTVQAVLCTQHWHEAVIHVRTASIFTHTHTHLLDIAHHSNAAAYADGYKKCVMITKMALRVRQTN